MSKITDKIRKLSKEAADKKLAEEQSRSEKLVNDDLEIIERILKLVEEKLIYKEVKQLHSRRRTYVAITEDIVLKDYATKPEGYSSGGTSITWDEGGYYSYPHTVVRVNGHVYHHAGDLITKYKHEATKAMESTEKERDAAKARKEAIEELEYLEPTIKSLMLNYQESLGIKEQVEESK